MKHYEWSELDYVAGAAHAMQMSYGRFVAAGMPNLAQFKGAVERDEIVTIQKGRRGYGVTAALQSMKLTAKPKVNKPKVDKRAQRKNLVCLMCEKPFEAEIKAGALPRYCPECKAARRKMQKTAYVKRYRERKKAGECLA